MGFWGSFGSARRFWRALIGERPMPGMIFAEDYDRQHEDAERWERNIARDAEAPDERWRQVGIIRESKIHDGCGIGASEIWTSLKLDTTTSIWPCVEDGHRPRSGTPVYVSPGAHWLRFRAGDTFSRPLRIKMGDGAWSKHKQDVA